MEINKNRNKVSSFDLIAILSKKYPDQRVREIINEYLKLKEEHLINGDLVKEPIGLSQITLRRVSSPKMFNVTPTSTRSVKIVTELTSRISSSIILKSIEDNEYSKLLSNGRVHNEQT